MADREHIPARTLQRVERALPVIVWELDEHTNPQMLQPCAQVRADWFLVSSSLGDEQSSRVADSLASSRLIVGLHVEHVTSRSKRALVERLESLRLKRCDAVLLESASAADLKGGTPFHRLAQWRDQGLTKLLLVEAESVAAGEWMVEHSPAHAVVTPFGLGDQSARFRMLESAAELGTGVLARRAKQPVWNPPAQFNELQDVRFVLGHEAVTAVIEPLPENPPQLDQLLHAARYPMDEADRRGWWEAFSAQVAPPPRPKRSHPPEEA